ncbi:MAG: ABC transporter substrate-binding protein [Muribaculaceae bacterium]|nr:ABC transporter substrate-binding protein [Muribaculaceae bacterium]
MKFRNYILTALGLLLATSCVRGGASPGEFTETVYTPTHAHGFRIVRAPGSQSTMIEVTDPWQGADSVKRLLFIGRGGETPPRGVMAIDGNAANVVCMSSSHVGLLDAIGATDHIKGVSGIGFITNAAVQMRRDSIADVGYGGNTDYERLLSVRPDVVLLYGVDGPSPLEDKLSEFGIPILYVGDYLEHDPLGRAEWMVALGELTGHREQAEARFSAITTAYDSIHAEASRLSSAPKVMLNAPYGDSWFMPPVQSYMVRLISDASGCYIYPENRSGISQPIDMELATMLLGRADIWLQPGQAMTLNQARAAAPKARFDCPVYNSSADFWESGAARPDLVLRDMTRMIHDHDTPDSTLTYFHRLK